MFSYLVEIIIETGLQKLLVNTNSQCAIIQLLKLLKLLEVNNCASGPDRFPEGFGRFVIKIFERSGTSLLVYGKEKVYM